MPIVLIANIISLAGCVIMVVIGLLKTKRQILTAQCVQCGLLGVANLMLGGTTGFVTNVVTVLRNLICFRVPFSTGLKLFFIVIQIALAIPANKLGIVGLLPVMAAVLFTWFLDTDSPIRLKLVIIAAQLMWLIYDVTILNYTGAAFDALTIVTNAVSIRTMKHAARPD